MQMNLLPLRVVCVGFLYALAALQPAFAAEELGPDAVADLYFKATLNRDVQAAKALNAYMKPATKDKGDMVDVAELESYEAFQAREIEKSLGTMPADTPPGMRESMRDMYAGITKSYTNTQCASKTRQIADNEHSPGGKIATVEYTCKIPKPSVSLKEKMGNTFQRMAELQDKKDVSSAQALKLADDFNTTMHAYMQEMQSPKEVDVQTGTAKLHWEKETPVWLSIFDLPFAMKAILEKIEANIPMTQMGK